MMKDRTQYDLPRDVLLKVVRGEWRWFASATCSAYGLTSSQLRSLADLMEEIELPEEIEE